MPGHFLQVSLTSPSSQQFCVSLWLALSVKSYWGRVGWAGHRGAGEKESWILAELPLVQMTSDICLPTTTNAHCSDWPELD